jgi:hypothetical protein
MNLLESREKRAAAETAETSGRRADKNRNGMKGTPPAIAGNAMSN